MKNTDIHLSIILPIYNSESFLRNSLSELDRYVQGLDFQAELLIVDDGSDDGSLNIALNFAKGSHPYSVKVIELGENEGKGAGVARGMLEAHGEFRIFLDSDLAYHPSQMTKILKALEAGNDVAIACRVDKESRYTISPTFFHYLYTRHFASRVLNFILRKTLIPHCRDSQAGLKGFKAGAAREIFSRQIIRGFPFDVEALFLAERMGLRIREVAIDYKYFNEPTTVVFTHDAFEMIRDIIKIRLHHVRGRYQLPQGDGTKRVIVNADDFGMNIQISKGIIKAARGLVAKSTSVMTNSHDFGPSMAELSVSNVPIDAGFHANLTVGRPLTDPEKIKTLVDEKGNFLPRNKLLFRSLTGKISSDEAYAELHAQCKRLHERIGKISHMDGHHHVHVFPKIRDAAERVAHEFNIPFVRAPKEEGWSPLAWAGLRRLTMKFLKSSRPEYWRGRGFMSTDWFGGFALGAGRKLKERWLTTLSRIPTGVTEIMVHPGYESDTSDSYNTERESEILVLTDPKLLETAKKYGVEFVSFGKIISEG